MPLTLIKYPVEAISGKVINIFAGFQPVEVEFKREDIQIVSVGAGVDNKILIKVTGDITASLNVGESVYLKAVGATFTYNVSANIITKVFAAETEITIDAEFIEVSTSGYVNYKQNYFVEGKLVDVDNNNVQVYPELVEDDGDPSGVIFLNVSSPVDYLQNNILENSGEVTDGRIRFLLKYREVWRENQTEAFVLLDDTPIVIIYAADNSSLEAFVNDFEVPKMWAGYPFSLVLLHSLQNNSGKRYSVTFDELDINEDDITNNNALFDFESLDFGFLQANFIDNEKIIEDNTRFIRFNVNDSIFADYETVDYNDTDYLTINTP